MTTPLITVIVPCFNLGEYLGEALESLDRQTDQDFEALVIDDGSTDAGTVSYLSTLDRPKVRVLRTEHRGVCASRNLGIREARGEFISCLDADDVLGPTFLERTKSLLTRRPDLSFASTWLRTFGDESWAWQPQSCTLEALLGECTVCTPALVRASAVRAVGGFDERMPQEGYEDWDLWICLTERGFTGSIIEEHLFFYRKRRGSLSSKCSGSAHLRLMSYLYAKHRDGYVRHSRAILAARQGKIGEALWQNDRAERAVETRARPELILKEAEANRLRRKIGDLRARNSLEDAARLVPALEAELNTCQRRIVDLHQSASWRLTRPLRSAYDLGKRAFTKIRVQADE